MNIKLSKQQQQIAAAAVFGTGAFVYCYVQFFWLPISKKTAKIQSEIAGLERDIQTAQRQAARLPDLERQLVSLNERKIEAEKRLPKTKAVSDILVTLDSLGVKHGVMLLSFAPGPVKQQQYFIEYRFPVSARGTFHGIGKFLAALALEQRLYNVFNVNYPEPSGVAGEMMVTFELVSYQYKEG
ncbi:MAG: type 4a pilus biogenesis protein PilO [Elusimicrobia bacterium]|nr:type 4a pilus biogenesis protein PilO [Elusimicrobiota bacterium]